MSQKNLTFDYNGMMTEYAPNGKRISAAELELAKPMMEQAFAGFEARRAEAVRKSEMTAWAELPYVQGEIVKELNETAKQVREQFESFVVLGIGGSALGPIAMQQALNHYYYNELPAEKRRGPKFYVIDNVDPVRMNQLFDVIDVTKTCFNVITKSGSTSETMSQYLIISAMLKERIGEGWAKNIIATTDAAKGNLIKIAKQEGIKCFVVPDGVGGRFSELSPVGLLAAAVCGIDIEKLLEGAAAMDALCRKADFTNPALVSAVLSYYSMLKGCNISVMMPYADSLKFIADWYAQLWAESLGKRVDRNGKPVFAGQTPVKALGVTDQHSQVQLYTEGPVDKVITFIGVEDFGQTLTIPEGCKDIPSVSFLCGHTMNELLNVERVATEYAVNVAGRPTRTILLPEVNEFYIGELLYFFELETAYTGELLGINTYDQPGVEGGKIAAYAMLGREGYDEKRAELANAPAKKAEFII